MTGPEKALLPTPVTSPPRPCAPPSRAGRGVAPYCRHAEKLRQPADRPPRRSPPRSRASARTPNSKATKPELKPLEGYLADLLNPAINRGNAVPGGASGFSDQPQAGYRRAAPGPVMTSRRRSSTKKADSAFDRRRGRAAAAVPRLRCSTLLETGSPFIDPGKPWTPHRPARPEKSEGGSRFRMQFGFEPAGDQPTAIAELVDGIARQRARPGAARRHRLGQDLHHGAR